MPNVQIAPSPVKYVFQNFRKADIVSKESSVVGLLADERLATVS